MQKRSDLSDVQKGMIIDFRAKGGSISETAKCGAPCAIDDSCELWLRRCVRANRRATVEQLTTQMNQGVPTVSLKLQFSECCCIWTSEALMLTAAYRQRRMEFDHQYHNWTSTEWRLVFSNESRFMLHRIDGR
ncbi:transposable element Tcb1 transposase [Trichonephila clavipes]|nr:transposable element Tcb1 transposase [Trichonephila clavipes]